MCVCVLVVWLLCLPVTARTELLWILILLERRGEELLTSGSVDVLMGQPSLVG